MNDIICAAATAPVNSALAMIRISGSGVLGTVSAIFSKAGKISHAKALYGEIKNGNELVDDVILTYFEGPKSFTGEDTVEVSCHGNPIIVKKILMLLLSHGARLAEPGEFSRRAFLNGKIDLTEAEAVNRLITARSDWEISAAIKQMHGALRERINALRERLIMIKADIECGIDFAGEDIQFISYAEAFRRIEEILADIDDIRSRCKSGQKLSNGIDLPLIGKPNVGKSSILNLILNQDRAIVSHIPGTTRDMIRETIQFGGVHVNLYDTAGIRDAQCDIERIGVQKSRDVIDKAQIVIMVCDSLTGITDEDRAIIENLADKRVIYLANKSDAVSGESIEKLSIDNSIEMLPFSALNGSGLDVLKKKLSTMIQDEFAGTGESYAADMRVVSLLDLSMIDAAGARNAITDKMPEEIVAYELQVLIGHLSEITGEISTEDILDSVFSRFCIGK